MKTGWKKWGKNWYYLGADGAMVTSAAVTVKADVTYEFDEAGVCLNP